jgi:hypothetical protein
VQGLVSLVHADIGVFLPRSLQADRAADDVLTRKALDLARDIRFCLERGLTLKGQKDRPPVSQSTFLSADYAEWMQRLFSMFAGGTAGVALLILRMCACGFLVICACSHLQVAYSAWPLIGVAITTLLLGFGVFTPIACIAGGLVELYCMPHVVGADLWQAVGTLMVFVALGLLGPGAYSIDAKLFGRRLIVPGKD